MPFRKTHGGTLQQYNISITPKRNKTVMMKRSELSLERLLPHFLMNYNLIDDVSLMHGKMGGVIFLNIYIRKSGLNVYRDYTDLLLDDIYKQINTTTPIDFANGLCGIGWSIEYLIKNQFYKGCTDDLLSGIDDVIVQAPPETLDHTFMTGIGGLLFYVISRVKSFKRPFNQTSFNLDYMMKLQKIIKNKHSDIYQDSILTKDLDDIINQKINYTDSLCIPSFFFNDIPPSCVDNLYSVPIGVYQGLTGWALKKILS